MPEDSAISSEQFDYGPKFSSNAEKESQGTLFRVDKSLMDPAKRYPRGYTPERMQEVQAAEYPYISHWMAGQKRRGPDYVKSGTEHISARTVHETIARSTIPVEHLDEMHIIHVQDERQEGDPAGYYRHESGHVQAGDFEPAHINMFPVTRGGLHDTTDQKALIHEIGHHAHREDDLPMDRSDTENDAHHEALADNYAQTHFRPDPRNKEQAAHPSGYEAAAYLGYGAEEEMDDDRGWGFTRNYRKERNPPTHHEILHGRQFEQWRRMGLDTRSDQEQHEYYSAQSETHGHQSPLFWPKVFGPEGHYFHDEHGEEQKLF